MRHRFPITTALIGGMLLFGTVVGVWGCTGQPDVHSEPGMSIPTTVPVVTSTLAGEAGAEYVKVIHPYHNEFLDAPLYLIPETITLAEGFSLPDFPRSIPAQRITSETLPATDLDFTPKPVATGHYLWFGPCDDLSSSDAELGSQDAAADVARAFLEAHALWDDSYSEPKVSAGSSETGPDGIKITSWLVRFEREEAAPGLERYVSVRVGDKNEVIQLSLAVPRLEPVEGKVVRLHPVSEVTADLAAWKEGSFHAPHNAIQGPVDVEIRGVSLAYEDPASGDEPIAVPVYRFEVEIRSVDGDASATGVWTVVAAADVVRDSAEDGIRDHNATTQAQTTLLEFLQAWAAKDLVAWKALLSDSRQKDMNLGDWTFADLDHIEFGPMTEAQEVIEPWLRGGDRGVTSDDVRCFRVPVTFYSESGVVGPNDSGEEYPWMWFVIRDADGQWRVADWGA